MRSIRRLMGKPIRRVGDNDGDPGASMQRQQSQRKGLQQQMPPSPAASFRCHPSAAVHFEVLPFQDVPAPSQKLVRVRIPVGSPHCTRPHH